MCQLQKVESRTYYVFWWTTKGVMKFPHLVHNPKLGYILPKRLYVRLRGVGSGWECQKPGPQGSSQLGGLGGDSITKGTGRASKPSQGSISGTHGSTQASISPKYRRELCVWRYWDEMRGPSTRTDRNRMLQATVQCLLCGWSLTGLDGQLKIVVLITIQDQKLLVSELCPRAPMKANKGLSIT